jgi:hypothetical protein
VCDICYQGIKCDDSPRTFRQLKKGTVEHLLKHPKGDKCLVTFGCPNKRDMLWPCGCVLGVSCVSPTLPRHESSYSSTIARG